MFLRLFSVVFILSCFILVTTFAKKHPKDPKFPIRDVKSPHIIFVLGDDIGHNDVGWNNPNIQTPFMNKLAEEGVILDQHYSLPLCTPSRASLLTGRHATTLGLQRGVLQTEEPYGVPTKFKFISDRLKEAHYSTHVIGKWHVGYCHPDYTPTRRGFDSFFGFYNGAQENYQHCNNMDVYFADNCTYYDLRDNTNEASEHIGEFSSSLYAKQAVKVIQKHNKRQPLFMYLTPTAPHFPVQPRYSKDEKFCKGCEKLPTYARQTMCCAMNSMDFLMKSVVEALKKKGMYKKSIIVFISDNGGAVHFGGNNYPYRGQKLGMYEGGSLTPGFVHSPLLQKTGYKNKNLIHITDWYPTILHLAGIDKDPSLDGINQWDTISRNMTTEREEILYNLDFFSEGDLDEENIMVAALRVGDYKIIISTPDEASGIYTEEETVDESFNVTYLLAYTDPMRPSPLPSSVRKHLYNLKVDPYENNDLMENLTEENEKIFNEILENKLRYYIKVAKRAVKFQNDPAGSPSKNDNWYWSGWCQRYYDVPSPRYVSSMHVQPAV